MISILIDIIGPVALLVALGYFAVLFKFFPLAGVPHLNKFVLGFAVPMLLFNAVRQVDLAENFRIDILASYFIPAFIIFILGTSSARKFNKGPQAAVVLGFCALFANSVYIGLPISERAYGEESLVINYVVLSVHAAFCYIVGSIAIQIARPDATNWGETLVMILKDISTNPLIIGIALGFFVNITGLKFPAIVDDAIAMQVRTALPVALFALGGVLTSLSLKGEMRVISAITVLRLFLHPVLVLIFAHLIFALPLAIVKSLVLLAALPTGTNGFIFAALYKREEKTSASVVFLSTILSLLTLPFWIFVLELL